MWKMYYFFSLAMVVIISLPTADLAAQDCDLNIDFMITIDESCAGAGDGSISVTASCSSCTGIKYSIDGDDYQSDDTFKGLKAGNYQVTARAWGNPGCKARAEAVIAGGTGEDDVAPVVTAALPPYGGDDDDDGDHKKNRFKVKCDADDNCDPDPRVVSVIELPRLSDLDVSYHIRLWKRLSFKVHENKVYVRAPNPHAFWAEVVAAGGIAVEDRQVITLKGDDDDDDDDDFGHGKYIHYKFFNGRLISITASRMTLRCTATDDAGNTATATATAERTGGDDDDDDD